MSTNRQPAHLEYVGGKSPRQRIWEKIRELKEFGLPRLVRALPGTIHKDTTRTYVTSLAKAGFITLDAETKLYTLTRDNGVEAPKVRKDGTMVNAGSGQENMWRTLRSAPNPLGYVDLAYLASTEQTVVAPAAARDYLANLEKAGYLACHAGKYRLLPEHNTGPRPPMVQRIKQVYDPNLGAVVWTDAKDGDDE
ncbi:hypothetical protein ACQE3D_18270 [Methylomonas sp. MS20]|uniref:hypothetical protein n=1 Tax=Methylomonas sp. MS20 TaxID=3418769 RepID=UPI003CFFEA89